MKATPRFACAASLSLLCGIACSQSPELVPAAAPAAPRGPQDTVIAEASGVQVTVQNNKWTGDEAVLAVSSPVLVTVVNRSSTPIVVRHDDFTLMAPDGRRFTSISRLVTSGRQRADARRAALPEGVVVPNQRVSGFVYFEPVDAGAGPLTILADFETTPVETPVRRPLFPGPMY